MVDKYSKYKREQPSQEPETDEFSQYARDTNTSGNPNSSGNNQGLLNRLDRNILIGLANAGQAVHNTPSNLVSFFSPELGSYLPRTDIDFSQTFRQPQKETFDVATQQIAEILPAMFIPGSGLGKVGKAVEAIPGVGKYARAGLGEAIPQTAYATMLGLENSPQDVGKTAALTAGLSFPLGAAAKAVEVGSPALKAAGHLGLGAAGGYAGHEFGNITGLPGASEGLGVLGAILGGKGIGVNTNAQKHVFGGLKPEQAREFVDASRRLGLEFVTPAEAFPNQYNAKRLATVGRTPEGSELWYERGRQRAVSEEASINKFIDDVYNYKMTPERQRLYDNALIAHVPDETVAALYTGSPLIEKAVKIVDKSPIYQEILKKSGYDKNTVGYWNQVKIALDDMAGKLEGKQPGKASIIKETTNRLKDELDSIEPTYSQARSIGQRKIISEKLKKHFNNSEMNAQRMNIYLKNREKFDSLKHDLRAFPEFQQTLDDMKTVFPKIMQLNPTNKAVSAQEYTGMTTARNPIDALRDFFQRNIHEKQDVAAVQLMTDPKWLEKLEALAATGGNPKQADELFSYMQKTNAPTIQEAQIKLGKEKPGVIPPVNPDAQKEALRFFEGNPMLAEWLRYISRSTAQGVPKAMEGE